MLDGFTIGVTADRRSDEQISLFERRGATVVHGPALRTLPLDDDERLRHATEQVIRRPPEVLVANTGIGIRSWLGAAEAWGLGEALLDALRGTRVYARGPKAAGAVHSLGLEVVARPESERLADCVTLVLRDLEPGARVVLQLDGGPPPVAVPRLRAAGADLLEVPVYRWEPPSDPRAALRLVDATVAGRVHALTFTSAPAVASLLELADRAGLGERLRAVLGAGDAVVGCVGPVCAEAAVAAGLGGADLVQPRTYRLGPLVHAVAGRLEERRVRVAGLELSGSVVRCGDRRVELSHIEARILATLAHRGGAVVSKEDLLREVWCDPGGDPHVVEVAVARLRRRLGSDGAAVATVTRRGYALR